MLTEVGFLEAEDMDLFEDPEDDGLFELDVLSDLEDEIEGREEFDPEDYEDLGGAESYPDLEGSDPFAIRIPFISKEGHERLTRDAAIGLAGITGADRRALRKGVRRVDIGLRTHLSSGQQRRHALRRGLCQPLRPALRDIRMHLIGLYSRSLRAPSRRRAFELIGEALHLIQDAYSMAHVRRRRSAAGSPIVYIRFFGVRGTGAPREHGRPSDSRDEPLTSRGSLKPSARAAISASREFLRMMIRHRARRGRRASRRAEFARFRNRHFRLSRFKTEPSRFYRRCRP